MLASYLGLFFPFFFFSFSRVGGGSTKEGEGNARGKMERKRANKKRGGRVRTAVHHQRAAAGRPRPSVPFAYGAVRPHSPAPALLHVGTFAKHRVVQNLLSSASHMASLRVKCSLIWPLRKIL